MSENSLPNAAIKTDELLYCLYKIGSIERYAHTMVQNDSLDILDKKNIFLSCATMEPSSVLKKKITWIASKLPCTPTNHVTEFNYTLLGILENIMPTIKYINRIILQVNKNIRMPILDEATIEKLNLVVTEDKDNNKYKIISDHFNKISNSKDAAEVSHNARGVEFITPYILAHSPYTLPILSQDDKAFYIEICKAFVLEKDSFIKKDIPNSGELFSLLARVINQILVEKQDTTNYSDIAKSYLDNILALYSEIRIIDNNTKDISSGVIDSTCKNIWNKLSKYYPLLAVNKILIIYKKICKEYPQKRFDTNNALHDILKISINNIEISEDLKDIIYSYIEAPELLREDDHYFIIEILGILTSPCEDTIKIEAIDQLYNDVPSKNSSLINNIYKIANNNNNNTKTI